MMWLLVAACVLWAAPSEAALRGFLDSAGADGFYGWAVDEGAPSASIYVLVSVDGVDLAPVATTEPSPDLFPYGYAGTHRFFMPLPQNLKDGQSHVVRAYALTATGQRAELYQSPRTILVGTPQPPQPGPGPGPQPPTGDLVVPGTVTAKRFVANGPDPTALTLTPTPLENLGAPSDGTVMMCSNCQSTNVIQVCARPGKGALAVRVDGVWKCH